jgi:tetratricopeptide (TPR) repeat protein
MDEMDESKPKTKSKPTNYEIIYKIVEDNGEAMTLDEIIEAFKEFNPKHDKYNYRAAAREALKNKVGVTEIRSDTYDISRRLFDGRSFRIKPTDEALSNGLPFTIIPECGCLALSLKTQRKKDATSVYDKKAKRYYELSFYENPRLIFEPRLIGLEPWLEDVGFKCGDELILTCIAIEDRSFEIEHIPSVKREKTAAAVKAIDKELAAGVFELIEDKKVKAAFGSHLGYLLEDILNALLVAGTHKGDVVPSGIDEIVMQDDRLIVKDSHVFLKTDYERMYPNDDFESIEARFKKHMSEILEAIENDEDFEDYEFDDYDEDDEDFDAEDEAFFELIELASCVAMANNQKEAVKEWAEGESKEHVKATADLVGQMWNEVPRPELGFRSLKEASQSPGPDTSYIRNGSIVAVDFEKGRKVGRNDPCPCGSGKKYKKCCFAENKNDASGNGKITRIDSKSLPNNINSAGNKSINDIIYDTLKGENRKDDDFENLHPELEKLFINLAIVEHTVSDMYDHELDAIDPNLCRPCYRFLVACQYRERGNISKAIEILLALARQEGEDPALEYTLVYEELANCAVDRGDRSKALSWIERAIAYDQKHEEGIREDDLQQKFAEIKQMPKSTGDIDNIGDKLMSSNYVGTPLDEAQDLMYSAWDSRGKRRIELAKKALKISPDCADAYIMLAEETAKDLREAKTLYEKGVKAGERALGRQAFIDDAGHFWGLIETRPYMRARLGLAESLWLLGERDTAIEHFTDMLRLNPNDNQGIRYGLAIHLLEDGRDADCEKLLNQYEGEGSAYWLYNYALLMYRKSRAAIGTETQQKAKRKAEASLKKAVEYNLHVPKYLLGKKRLPKEPPEFIGIGDEKEAIAYVYDAAATWRATEGAIKWIQDNCK